MAATIIVSVNPGLGPLQLAVNVRGVLNSKYDINSNSRWGVDTCCPGYSYGTVESTYCTVILCNRLRCCVPHAKVVPKVVPKVW